MLTPRLTLLLASAALALSIQAQDSLLLRDYHYLKHADPWLTAPCAAALTRFNSSDMAHARLSLTHAEGGFTDYCDAPSVLQADARVESFFRLSPRTVVFGAMSYRSFTGRDMGGSAFIHSQADGPARHHPFDIVEDSLGNEGTKHLDACCLSGGFGTTLCRGLAVGARLDYTAANMAKYKDLRHKNKLMDLRFTAGVYIPVAAWAALGLSYTYHRTTESLLFSTYGKGDRTYVSFINYGPYIGQTEQFGQTGYTDRSREMPLVDDADGLAVQLSLRPATGLQFYNAFTYARRRGYYGRRSPYTITYTRHRSRQYCYHARLTAQQRGSRFHLDLSLLAENLQNNATTYREQQNDAGATHYEYYTPVKLADRLWVDGTVALTAHWRIRQALPAWTLQAGLRWAHRKQTAYLYPYCRRQRITAREPFAALTRRLPAAHGVWSIRLDASFAHGSGQPYEDMTFAEPSDKATPPPTMEAFLQRGYQWLTAAQYALGGSLKYSFPLSAAPLKTYVQASLHHRKCNNPGEYAVGRDRTTATLALGCEF